MFTPPHRCPWSSISLLLFQEKLPLKGDSVALCKISSEGMNYWPAPCKHICKCKFISPFSTSSSFYVLFWSPFHPGNGAQEEGDSLAALLRLCCLLQEVQMLKRSDRPLQGIPEAGLCTWGEETALDSMQDLWICFVNCIRQAQRRYLCIYLEPPPSLSPFPTLADLGLCPCLCALHLHFSSAGFAFFEALLV